LASGASPFRPHHQLLNNGVCTALDSSQAVVKSVQVVDAFQLVRASQKTGADPSDLPDLPDLPLHAAADAKWRRLRRRAQLLRERTLRDPMFAAPSSHELIARQSEVAGIRRVSAPPPS
jgi:myo-inositol catabolism protein IolC